jgi:hypothetical protein
MITNCSLESTPVLSSTEIDIGSMFEQEFDGCERPPFGSSLKRTSIPTNICVYVSSEFEELAHVAEITMTAGSLER